MLTDQDIQDLKDFTDDYDNFCKEHECDETCIVFQERKISGKSCFKQYCDMRRAQTLK